MFPPFTSPNQFYPGLIVWCDPNCYEMDVSTLAPNELYDRKKARQLHPCLVVAVDYNNNSLQVARICATTPTDTRRWVRVDSPPGITWRLSDAWIWVGTPPTVAMILNNGKAMHPHKDTKYTSSPVAAANLQNYWVHRQNYISWRQMRADNAPSTSASANTHYGQHQNTLYSTPSHGRGMYPSAPGNNANYFNQNQNQNQMPSPSYHPQAAGFNTLSPHPVVVPPGFTETRPNAPGWWRNPETGWFWHASRGLLPPTEQR